jgi:hypothetical protein
MRPKAISSLFSGLAVAALAVFTVLQLLAVVLLVRAMENVLGLIGSLF